MLNALFLFCLLFLCRMLVWCRLRDIFTERRNNSTNKSRHLSLDRRVLFYKIFTKGTKGLFDGAERAILKSVNESGKEKQSHFISFILFMQMVD